MRLFVNRHVISAIKLMYYSHLNREQIASCMEFSFVFLPYGPLDLHIHHVDLCKSVLETRNRASWMVHMVWQSYDATEFNFVCLCWILLWRYCKYSDLIDNENCPKVFSLTSDNQLLPSVSGALGKVPTKLIGE